MNDSPPEDQFDNPPGFFYVALTEAIADNDEDMMDADLTDADLMALEEATLQDDSSSPTEILDHDTDDIARERESSWQSMQTFEWRCLKASLNVRALK